MMKTKMVVVTTSWRDGHITRDASSRTCLTKVNQDVFAFSVVIFLNKPPQIWQERRDSNPQPPVLETGALPIELRS